MGNTSDLQSIEDDRVMDMLSQCTAKRTRSRRAMQGLVVLVFVPAVVSMLLSVEWLLSAALLGAGFVALLAFTLQLRSVGTQRKLDDAVIEVRRRGLIGRADTVVLERLDGTGFRPRMIVAETVSLAIATVFAIWAAVFFSADAPSLTLALMGIVIMAALLVAAGGIVILQIRAGVLKIRPTRD